MRCSRTRICATILLTAGLTGSCGPLHREALGQAIAETENDPEVARQRQIVDRFVTVLEKNPRRGTALDKVYGFHIENGSIEPFVKQLRDRVAAKSDDGAGWMILGLIESQRGRDAAAVEALTKAKELRKTDPLAAYYLGQSLVLIGQPDQAVAAFEEAIERKPAQVELLEIFQALGRVHQRAQRADAALAVWSRLEKLFPNDPRVQEQIALTLVEEGQIAQALPRYESLAKSTTDDYRRTTYRLEAADLKVKLNRATEGIADLEVLIAKLNPESWLFREVRRKIEEVFLRTDDQDGLAKYYTKWLEKNSEDVEAMARLARVLARQARVPEAQQWLEKALKLAPSRKELRLAFIDQLVDDRRFAEAVQQYVALDKSDPNNPDYLRDWGKVLLRDTARPKEERKTEAEKVWRRLVVARPNDPLIATQAADLFRHADMPEAALELYQKAVELAPTSPQYREYLGEFYHILKRPDDALATWKKMAEGGQRTATNVARLAEVYAQFGYAPQALQEIAAACELDPKDFSLQLKAAELQARSEAYEPGLASLARAEKLAQNDEEREAVLAQQIKIYSLQDKLVSLAEELQRKTTTANATHNDWFLLARYRESLHEYPQAAQAIAAALKLEPNHIRSLASAARIAEQAGDLQKAAELNRKLAVVDRRSRTEYLQHVATLETQLGRIDEALAAGRELIAAAPGNVETYQFFSDLCFRLNRSEDGLAALRRATRVNPNEPALLISLANALAGQFRTDEAIELFWQAFEKHPQLDDKLGDIAKLTDLYLQANHLDQLLERLERGRREADRRRELTICLAQAYQTAGDYGMARQELERLLNENTRDTQLLLQLSKLAEAESDFANATKYQEQLAKLAPGPESDYRLANLLSRAGNTQESAAIIVRLAAREENRDKLLRGIDGLLSNSDVETALAIVAQKLRENPTDWELLYRQGVATAKLTPATAATSFQALLDLATGDDELSTAAKSQQKKPPGSLIASRAAARRGTSRLDSIWEIRRAVGLDHEPYYFNQQSRPTVWMPRDFGQARLAAIGWMTRLAQEAGQGEAFVTARRERAESTAATTRELWDFVYLQYVRSETSELQPFTRRLAEKGGQAEKVLYLTSLAARGGAEDGEQEGPKDDKTPPLSPDELQFALKTWRSVRGGVSTDAENDLYGSANWTTGTILRELTRAGRKDEADQLYVETIKRSTTIEQLAIALQLAVTRDDRQQALALFDQLAAKHLQKQNSNSSSSAGASIEPGVDTLTEIIGKEQTPTADILSVLDHYLATHAAKVNQAKSSLTYRPNRASFQQGSTYLQIHIGKSYRGVQISYPMPNEYFDQQGLQLLRTAHEVFRMKDLASDLIQHVQKRGETAPPSEQIFDLLAAAYLQVWNDDRESAATTLTQAAALVPQDTALRLEVARLNLEMTQLDEALAVVESITPLDQRSMQQRESLALDLAVRLGDHQRARDAAQRLFGLRLDAESQITLAGQMRRLGMNEEAEAILARAQRQAGSRLSALTALMGQHQAQGKMELAAQVAQQILRRSRTASSSQVAMGYSTADSQNRSAALACLSQAGKLKELIAGIEEQLQRSPSSTQLYETLSEYYQAAGDTQKMLDLQAKVVSLRPDDGDLRFRYGQELYRRGKVNEACDEFIVVIKKQPRLIGQRYWEVSNAFQRARKEAELAKALSEIDLKSLGQPYMVSNLISNMMRNTGRPGANDNGARAAGMMLFKKAWEVFPDQRAELMSNFSGSEMWSQPEVLSYGIKSLVPSAEIARKQPWYGLNSSGWSSGGHIYSSMLSVFDGAAKTNLLPSVRKDIAAATTEFPHWKAGPILLAIIDLRQGTEADIETAVAPLLDKSKSVGREHYYEQWIIAQELASKPKYKELAVQLYESAASHFREDDNNYQYEYSADPPLAKLYQSLGRRDDARKLLLKALHHKPQDNGNYQYNLYRNAESLISIGAQFQEMDFPVDALRAYRELLTNPAYNDPQITSFSGRDPEYYLSRARSGIQAVTKKFGERSASEVALAVLAPTDNARVDVPAVDLMLTATTAGTSALPTLESPLLALIRPAGMTAAAAEQVEQQLAALEKQHPSDLSVPIAAALFALKGNDSAKSSSALDKLLKAVSATPLEPLTTKRANSRQRAEASRQIGLWLVARHCAAVPEYRSFTEPLAQRAIAAAQRQLDPTELVAVLHERSRLALDAQDRAAAEECWTELIELILVKPRQTAKSTAAPPANTKATTKAAAPAAPNGKIPATLSQFKLGAAIAQAAAENDLIPLSLRAIRESLSGGVPVADIPKTSVDGSAPRPARPTAIGAGNSRSDIDQAVFGEMSTRLVQLSSAWKRHAFPPVEICQLLEEIVFPASRPGDVLVYEQPLANDVTNPQSVGRLLVDWSLRAGREAILREQIAARQASATDVVGGLVLLVQLSVAKHEVDSTREHLQAIAKQLETSKLGSLVNLAAHGAAVALGDAQLVSSSLPLLEKLAAAPTLPGQRFAYGQLPTSQSAATIVTREHVKLGNADAARTVLERLLQTRQEAHGRIIGDSGSYYQRQDLAWAANELSRGGDLALTLAALGRFADVTASRDRDVPITSLAVALWHLDRQIRQLPPAERYERLRDWTLPTKERRSVRVVCGYNSGQPIPNVFLNPSTPAELAYSTVPRVEPVSNLTLLVAAATEANRLPELAQTVQPLVTDKVPGADILEILTLIAQRDDVAAGPKLQAVAARWQESIKQQAAGNAAANNSAAANRQPLPDVTEYLLARAAADVPELVPQAHNMIRLYLDIARRKNLREVVTHVSYDLAHLPTLALTPPERQQALTLPLSLWTAGTNPLTTDGTLPPAQWTVHDGYLFHATGCENDGLFFNVPLEGEFEFSYDEYTANYSVCHVGYGGTEFGAASYSGPQQITSVSHHEQIQRPGQLAAQDAWNRIKLQVRPNGIRYLVNDHLVYEDTVPSRTSPWLLLRVQGERAPAMKNLQLTGKPTVPQEIKLIDGDQLEGWNASFYGENLPQRLRKIEPASDSTSERGAAYGYNAAGDYVLIDPNAPKIPDWQAENGVLTGRDDPATSPRTRSRLFYHRPLAEGDRVAYEFYYVPGQIGVHPTFGRIAFLLDPAGLRLHWMAKQTDTSEPLLVDPRQTVAESSIRRGPANLPLNANAWNSVELSVDKQQLTIRLNGELICERPIEPTSDQRFGFFHFKADTAAKVRNVVLRGNWPQSLSPQDQNNLLATNESAPSADVQTARHRIIGERLFATAAYDVWKQSREMSPADRYEFLKNWVLPNSSHPTLRLQFDWTPADAIASVPPPGAGAQRAHSGAELVAPAWELITVAKELNKLDELTRAAAVMNKEFKDLNRPLISFNILLALARGDDRSANNGLKQALDAIKTQPAWTPFHERHGEYLASYVSLNSPRTRAAAKTLALEIAKDQQPPRFVNNEWSRRAPYLRALANWATSAAASSTKIGEIKSAQWQPVTRATAQERGEGYPAGAWHLAPGEATCLSGSPRSALYFSTPLTGDFEVVGQVTTAANKTIRILYGGIALTVNAEGKAVIRQEVGRANDTRTPLSEKPPGFGPNVEYKLAVKDSALTAFINGRQVHTERLSANVDPWLAIETTTPNQTGVIKNIRILGTPSVPRQLALSRGTALDGWMANYFGETISGAVDPDEMQTPRQTAAWSKDGEEIVAGRMPNCAGSFRESILRYHRPLLEDGDLEYEFFYEPGRTAVHPALDRLAFLLAPDGVRLHSLTDGQYERTALGPDNSSPLAGSHKVPLKANAWNSVRVSLRENTVQLFINNEEVATHPLDSLNDRTFGLFRYSDATAVKVRNVVYRGNWPITVPRVSDQELATTDSR